MDTVCMDSAVFDAVSVLCTCVCHVIKHLHGRVGCDLRDTCIRDPLRYSGV